MPLGHPDWRGSDLAGWAGNYADNIVACVAPMSRRGRQRKITNLSGQIHLAADLPNGTSLPWDCRVTAGFPETIDAPQNNGQAQYRSSASGPDYGLWQSAHQNQPVCHIPDSHHNNQTHHSQNPFAASAETG